MGPSWLKPAAGLLVGAVLLRAVFPQPDAEWMMGTWVLTDQDNVPFDLVLRPDGSSLTVTGKRHPDLGRPHRMASDQLIQTGRWQTWGNGIRSTYNDGWIDTIQVGPDGVHQWSWKPGTGLRSQNPAVQLTSPIMGWVGAYELEPTEPEKPPYLAVLTSSGIAFNDIDQVADGSWTLEGNGSVLIKWTSGWRTLLKPTADGIPNPEERFAVQHWRPGVAAGQPASANRSGIRL